MPKCGIFLPPCQIPFWQPDQNTQLNTAVPDASFLRQYRREFSDIFIHQTRIGMKTNKSFTKRIKVTKNGKLVARKPGQNHFNARQTGQQRLRRKRTQLLNFSKRISRRFLPGMGAKPLAETNGNTAK